MRETTIAAAADPHHEQPERQTSHGLSTGHLRAEQSASGTARGEPGAADGSYDRKQGEGASLQRTEI